MPSPKKRAPSNTEVRKTIAKTVANAIVKKEGITAGALAIVEKLPSVRHQTAYLLSEDFHQGDLAKFLLKQLPCINDIYQKYKKSGKNGKIRRDFGRKVESAATWALEQLDVDALMADLTADTLPPASPSKKPQKGKKVSYVKPLPTYDFDFDKCKCKFICLSAFPRFTQ